MYQPLTEFVEDFLSHLETESSDPAGKLSLPLYLVPSGATISGLCPQDLTQDELQCAVGISLNKRQVMDTTMCLVSLFTTDSPSRPENTSNIGFLTPDDSWTLSVLTRFWEAIAPEGAQLKYVESTCSSVVSFLDRIRVYLARISGSSSCLAIVDRVSTLCSHVIITFLVREPLPLPSSVERRLCLMLFDLALNDSKSGPRLPGLAGDTLLALFDIREDEKRFDAFGQDLQVRAGKCFPNGH